MNADDIDCATRRRRVTAAQPAREAKAAERAAQAKAREEARLAKSKFRSRFHLSDIEKSLVNEKGLKTIRAHCEGFIRTRHAPAYPKGDGRQTPMRGHPVFVAQHAITAHCGGSRPVGKPQCRAD